MRRGQLLVQRIFAAFVECAHGQGEWRAASVALVLAGPMGFALHKRCFANRAAMWADRIFGPKAGPKLFTGLGFVVEDRV